MWGRPLEEPRPRARRRRRGGAPRRAHRLPPGALPLALPVPGRGRCALRARRADPRPEHRGALAARRRARRRRRRLALRAPRAGPLPQHRGRDRRRRPDPRALPQDAHPRRSALLREVLLHARRYRLPQLCDARPARRHARVLGPVVPRGGAPHRALRRADPLLPDGDRLAVRRGRGGRPRAARGVGDRAARPRDRERRLRRRREPRRFRGRDPLLGPVLRRQSVRPRARARVGRRGGGARRRLRPRGDRARAPAVAFFARPAHRRVRRSRPPLARRRRRLSDEPWRWPAEWERHEATWLAWPHNPDTWPGRLASAREQYAAMVRELAFRERVRLLVRDARMEDEARAELARAGADAGAPIDFHRVATNDSWLRDSGPIFVVRGAGAARERLALDFGFNGWGGKYPPWDLDDEVPRRAAERLGLPTRRAGFVLEGGSIDGNGLGSVLTTESCLLNPNREPGRTRERMEERLAAWLGASNVLWLG